MATAFSSSLDQIKQAFCNEYAHLSEQHRQQLWLQRVATLPSSPPQPSQAQHVPRSMSTSAANMTQLLVWILFLGVRFPVDKT
jgi:preprotein translocase subunit Sec63